MTTNVDAPLPEPGSPQPVIGDLHGPVIGPAIRTWLTYLLPLTGLATVALAPIVIWALGISVPRTAVDARRVVSAGWTLLAAAWIGQLVLVGGAAPLIGERRSQLRAFGAGFVQLVQAIAPCVVAAAAVAIGGLALVVPGAILLVLLAVTGASRARGLPAPLLDSIAAVRRQLAAVALAVAALVIVDAGIGAIAFRALVGPLGANPTAAQLAGARQFVRAIAVALVVVSPIPATVLATVHARAARAIAP